ncbi:asparagine synthase (glutamine-hydrolyzing) [Planomonospora sp. ID91781]|uniref:asparagine synthase (glutamine-hydrolyzing) n=1 Tax=Planomonospora sphaerica TaxID=161355 RepID=A0A161LNJ6_9ACTN|nr:MULTISPECIES: asparagine synthase (glutamine-hydrolyzing) [Planomonospora]MBG0822908.1 asparagine synthase (glutamine-hydrolyzing) [Planomonospora sp. ID91781]GAT69295.1 asparagine synthase [Planomonospora sphaerica]
MCGITGWVAFERDPRTQRSAVEAMTETMACRGPDAAGTWYGRHVALGHRRLAVIDPAGGAQPMVADEDGHVAAAVSYSGEVYDFDRLRRELHSAGHRFRTRSDTEVVLRAYLEWGAGFARRLSGMFAFALWDARREELLLVRDRLGIKPLYYYPTADGVLFGSEPKAILAHPEARARLDASGLRELMTWAGTPGHAIFKGMFQVRPGHIVRVSRERTGETAYWELEARPHTEDLHTTIDRVRGLLRTAVASQTVADVPLCSLLSGGLDSSSVAVFAADAMRARGEPALNCFSVGFTGPAPAAGPGPIDDADYATKLASQIGAAHETITLDARLLSDPATRAAVLRARDLPQGLADMDTSLYLLFKAVRQRSTVALSGEGADELFGGYPWFHDEATTRAQTFPWMYTGDVSVPQGPSFLDPSLPERLALDEYRAACYAEAVAAVPSLPGEPEPERRMRRVGHLFLTRFLPMLLERKDRMSMAVGLEVRVPFCDHSLVEYLFNVPWPMKAFDGREKSLLRAAMASDLPEFILARRKAPYPMITDPDYDQMLKGRLSEIMEDRGAPVRALMDTKSAQQAFAAVRQASPEGLRFLRVGFESLIRINDWMRDYRVELGE